MELYIIWPMESADRSADLWGDSDEIPGEFVLLHPGESKALIIYSTPPEPSHIQTLSPVTCSSWELEAKDVWLSWPRTCDHAEIAGQLHVYVHVCACSCRRDRRRGRPRSKATLWMQWPPWMLDTWSLG